MKEGQKKRTTKEGLIWFIGLFTIPSLPTHSGPKRVLEGRNGHKGRGVTVRGVVSEVYQNPLGKMRRPPETP